MLAIPLAIFNKGKEKQKMLNVSLHRQFGSIAKQAGTMPAVWFANNSLSCDRTPEGYISPGSWRSKV